MDLAHTYYGPPGPGPHPTIVALHGWGASAFDLIGLAPHLAGGRLQMICPQGPLPVPIGDAVAGYGWFPLVGLGQPAASAAMEESAARLARFLDAALARYPVDRGALVLAGFSQGGVLAYRLALADPARFAGLVALSSWLPPPLAASMPAAPALARLPTLVQHGTRDEVIALARARQSVEALRALGVPVTYREYAMGHEISPESFAALGAWLGEHLPAAARA